MKKALLYILVLVLIIGLGGVGIYEYTHRPTTESLQTALVAQSTLEKEVKTLQLHDAVDYTNSQNYQHAASVYNSEKTQLCSLAQAHKLATANLCD